MINKLSDKKYWNYNYENKVFLPVKHETNSVDLFSLNKIFKRYIPFKKGESFIELGCAPGGWMYYFNYYFGLNVSGIDYAEEGVEITKENMRILSVKADVILGDILKFKSDKKYKVVFSAGLIEHFNNDDLKAIIGKHFETAENGGYIIIIIPNLKGWNYFYQKLINRKNLDIHNIDIMNIDFFRKVVDKNTAKEVFLGYAGKINFGLYSGNKFFGYLHTIMQIFVNFMFFRLKIKFSENRNISPYILAIYKKL